MSDVPPVDLGPDELDELIASVGALRSELDRRFTPAAASGDATRPPPEPPVEPDEPAPDASLPARARDELMRLAMDADPARWLAELRRLLPLPSPADASDDVDAFGLDRGYLDRARTLLDFLYERWWRVEVSGARELPDEPRMIFVANRSGVLPYDGLMLAHAIEREHASGNRPRFLVEDWLMTRPFAQPVLTRLGGVRACPENAERLLDHDAWISVFPEGHKGALKRFGDRYRLQRFGRGGFVSLAVRRRARLVPVAIVGAEETHPVLARSERLERLLGGVLPMTATFPALGPFGLIPLPSQWRIRVGTPIELGAVDPDLADDRLFVNRTRERVRSAIQELLDEEVDRRYSVWS